MERHYLFTSAAAAHCVLTPQLTTVVSMTFRNMTPCITRPVWMGGGGESCLRPGEGTRLERRAFVCRTVFIRFVERDSAEAALLDLMDTDKFERLQIPFPRQRVDTGKSERSLTRVYI